MQFCNDAYHKTCTSSYKERSLTPLLYHLGPFCARHSVLILVVWVVVALSVVILAGTVGQERNDDLKLRDTDSQAASDLLSDKFLDQANGSVPIALRAPEGAKLSDSKYKKSIQRATKAYTRAPCNVAGLSGIMWG